MFDAQVKESRITLDAAKRAGLEGEKCQVRYVETLGGGMTTVDEIFRVPLEDRQGEKVALRAIGTRCITYSHGYELPKDITSVCPGMSTDERDYKMAAGAIDLVIGSDYASWLPKHICDSWDPDDNYRLMESRFEPRHLVVNIEEKDDA
jgi:hypothetical protein